MMRKREVARFPKASKRYWNVPKRASNTKRKTLKNQPRIRKEKSRAMTRKTLISRTSRSKSAKRKRNRRSLRRLMKTLGRAR